MLGGHPLDSVRDQFAGPFFAFFARLRFDLAVDAGHVGAGFLLDGGEQVLSGLILGHLRDLFQALHLRLGHVLDLVGTPVNGRLALIQGLFALFKAVSATIQLGAALVQAFGLAAELVSPFLDLPFGGLHHLGGAFPGLCFDQTRLFAGAFENAFCFLFLVLDRFIGQVFMEQISGCDP